MPPIHSDWTGLYLLQGIMSRLHERQGDLTPRQTIILLHIYLSPPPHTVKSITSALSISKPAVSRALAALARQDLIGRQKDAKDHRNVYMTRTLQGTTLLTEIAAIIDTETRHSSTYRDAA